MTERSRPLPLPHHRLVAFHVAKELLIVIKRANIRDAKLRDEALRAAKGACCNIAEGAGRWTPGEKRRAFAIARGEGVEAFAALETAAAAGDAAVADVEKAFPLASRLYGLLTGLLGKS